MCTSFKFTYFKKIFNEQEGNVINRYKMRKQAENGEVKHDYKLTPQLNTTTYESFMKDKYNETLKGWTLGDNKNPWN